MIDDLEFELELESEISGEEIEHGGRCNAPGWYLCTVHDIERNSDSTHVRITYKIAAGAWKGGMLHDNVWMPGSGLDPDKEEQTRKRFALIASRLGLWDGEKTSKLRVNFAEAIGRPCVLEVIKRSWTNQKGEKQDGVQPAYTGIYPPDHPKIPLEVRKSLNLPPAREKSKDSVGQQRLPLGPAEHPAIPNAAARRPTVDLSDL